MNSGQQLTPMQVLERLMHAVAHAAAPERVHDLALDALRDAIGVTRASILLFDTQGIMRFVAWRGLSDQYRARVEGHSPWTPDSVDAEPVLVADATEAPDLTALLPVLQAEGIAALAFIPLIARGRVIGKFMLYYGAPRVFSSHEVLFASTAAHYVAFAIDRHKGEVERTRLLHQVEIARQRADFRARVTTILASSLDYDATLHQVARLMVPVFADWCTVDLLDDASKLRRRVVAHRDADDEAKLIQLRDFYNDVSRPLPTEAVLRSGAPLLATDITASDLRNAAIDADYYQRVSALAPISSIVLPLRTTSRVLGVMSFVYARSGRRYTEGDLALAEDLAQSAAIAIENARLFGELQGANRMKDEFLATLSHELRTPLNAILGWSSMLSSRPIEDALLSKGVAAIDRNARAQTKLINDLLDVSRIVSGKLQLARSNVDILKVIDAAIDAVRLSSASKGIRLEAPAGRDLPRIVGDPDRLQQIIWNLLSNAVKFTPEGGRITIDAAFDGTTVEVSVTDDGVGIAADFLPHVFDRFRQGDASSTRMYSGLGLGLSIVRQLTELHGGTVRAYSDGPGTGARFTVRLPANRGATLEPSALESRSDHVENALKGIQVLVVDDDRDAREFVQVCLQRSGARVHIAGSAADAARHLTDGVDLLITDIAMPGQDGFSVLRQARAARPNLPAIAFTAYARPEDSEKLVDAGFNRHLTKPAEARGLVEAVSALVRAQAH